MPELDQRPRWLPMLFSTRLLDRLLVGIRLSLYPLMLGREY